ncbi:MAG: putative bifunctional diguanylate cyclase/phosphodiesterase [Acidobacteriota bacterium]
MALRPQGKRPGWIPIAVGVAVAAAVCLGLWRYATLSRHIPLRALQDAPLGSRVRLAGVVTYVDGPGKRFWIQDDTGAIPIPLDPGRLRLHVGQIVGISGLKATHFNPALGSQTITVQDVRVVPSTDRITLPTPLPVSLAQFPSADKNGIQIQISGVVHRVRTDRLGRTEIDIATTGPELPVIVPGSVAGYSALVNASVRAMGVPETFSDPATRTTRGLEHRLWIASRNNLQIIRQPSSPDLYTIRRLYSDPAARSGHLVLVRGRVLQSSPHSILIDGAPGTLDCQFDSGAPPPVAATVEAEGFPTWDGLRISLQRARIRALPATPASAPPADVIQTVRAIRSLPAAQADQALPVRIHGVITYFDPIWRQLYVQDSTAGIYVKYNGNQHLQAGDRVLMTGLTNAGNFAPVVVAPKIQLQGKAPLPTPVVADNDLASQGLLDSQFVRIEGVIYPLKFAENPLRPIITFELMSALGPVHVFASQSFPTVQQAARRFEDARVEIHGVLGSVFNSRRQLIGYQLLIADPSQIRILEPAVADPFSLPKTPIADLLQFSPHTRPGHRVKVAGVVTFAQPDRLYLQDATSGVEIRGDTGSLHVGDSIQAVGYPKLVGKYSPVMTDAEFRPAGSSHTIAPRATTAEAVLGGEADSTLVSLDARLLAILNGPSNTTLVLQSGVRTFTAVLSSAELGANLAIRPGSVLRLTGVCSNQIDAAKIYTLLENDPANFQILLRTPADITVVRPAPYWTTRATLILFALISLLIPTTLAWVAVLRRRVQRQTAELRKAAETTQAIRDLSTSMRKVAREQQYDKRVSVRGRHEVAQLVVAFNHMLAQLRQREDEKNAAEAKLQHMAMIDELTGLPNRRMLFDNLAQKLAAAKRDNHQLALLYIDLDGFKLVNDNLGHNIGDMVLAEVARRLRARARASDTVARIGGDEFTLILDQIKEPADAEIVAHELLQAITARYEFEGTPILIGASIGISLFPDHAGEGGQLLQQADCAMYAAKHNGKNQIVQFGHHLGNAARQRLILENDLRNAVEDGSITVHYQPEFDLATRQIVRFEALARWQHPTLGNIPPMQFISIAEENGLIVPLGAHILERACRDALRWNAAAGRPIPVAVNVSSVQFARASFVQEVADILIRTGLDPTLLQIELTESATLAGVQHSSVVLHQLKDMGITLALDDFGTGYSCLSYLPRLPFDALKVDRSFLKELLARPESSALLKSILTMARNLDMRVIVEGIETDAELNAVIALGASDGQGYLLGRPSPDPLTHLSLSLDPTADPAESTEIAVD